MIDVFSTTATAYNNITADSRRVKDGFLFVALPPSFNGGQDGHDYIGAAIENGAAAVLTNDPAMAQKIIDEKNSDKKTIDEKTIDENNENKKVEVIASENPRRDLSLLLVKNLAKKNMGLPSSVALVTGTNGKSSIVQMARSLWAAGNGAAASVGTLGIVRENLGNITTETIAHTTPDPEWLYPAMAKLHEEKIDHVAIEASSHGLHQYRLDGLGGHVAVAAMAELSQDHLDYHETLENYYDSKLRLFTELLSPDGRAIFWHHSPLAEKIASICDERHVKKIMMSRQKNAAAILCLHQVQPTDDAGQVIDFTFLGRDYQTTIPLTGYFQVENALTALMMVMADNSEGELERYLPHLAKLQPIRGRIEKIDEQHRGAYFFVDYAHTDAALATALQTLRPFVKKNLIVVFGCGGDRDIFKRPKMGKVANDLADKIIITDDNPRGEVPSEIRKAIMATCPKAVEATHRRQAIAMAVAMADKGDVVLVAGKGHETGQTIGTEILPFDDAEVIREEIINAKKNNDGGVMKEEIINAKKN